MKTRIAGSAHAALDQSTRPLILDFLAWLAIEPRPYADVMEVWRTSCPRLPIWEDAVDAGLVVRRASERGVIVELTAKGQALAAAERPHG
jgi:hypothetical protein